MNREEFRTATNVKVTVSILDGVAAAMKKELRAARFKLPPYRHQKPNLTTDRIGMLYMSALRASIEPRPRVVHWLPRARGVVLPDAELEVLRLIEESVRVGLNVNGYLTKRRLKGEHEDAALHAFGQYHLHLARKSRPGVAGFDNGWLLFAIFRDRDAYFVDLRPHRVWIHQAALAEAAAEWPDLFANDWHDRVTPEPPLTDEQLSNLLSNGLNVILNVGGRAMALPGGGIMGSGESADARFAWDRTCRQAARLHKLCVAHAEEIASKIESLVGSRPHEMSFIGNYEKGVVSVTEKISGMPINFIFPTG